MLDDSTGDAGAGRPELRRRNRPGRVTQPAGAGRMDRLIDHRPVCRATPTTYPLSGGRQRGENTWVMLTDPARISADFGLVAAKSTR